MSPAQKFALGRSVGNKNYVITIIRYVRNSVCCATRAAVVWLTNTQYICTDSGGRTIVVGVGCNAVTVLGFVAANNGREIGRHNCASNLKYTNFIVFSSAIQSCCIIFYSSVTASCTVRDVAGQMHVTRHGTVGGWVGGCVG